MAKKKRAVRRKKQAAASIGLSPAETVAGVSEAEALTPIVERDGGAVLGAYRDPFGGTPVLIVSLPIDRVEPTPYQRDPSDAHVKRLMKVIETLGRFLDPIIVVRHDDRYWTPNGNHRLQAMKPLGARAIVALLVPDAQIAYQILALNTEKAHNLREKSLETIRMARALAERHARAEGGVRVSVRAAVVSDARRRLRVAAAPERRGLPVGAAPDRRLPRQAAAEISRRA